MVAGFDKEKLMRDMFAGTGNMLKDNRGNLIDVDIDDLVDFHTGEYGHMFEVEDDEDMQTLERKIDEAGGILNPLLVRADIVPGKYEVIAGHRRKFIGRKKGYATLPAIVLDYDDDTAIKLMISTNVDGREHIKPSVLGKAYRAYMEANSRQGSRTDLTSFQVGKKLNANADAEKEFGRSKIQIWRFIRLTYLVDELQELVDRGKVKMGVGVELSFLTPEQQSTILDLIEIEKLKVSLKQAEQLHALSAEGKDLSLDFLMGYLAEEKAVKKIVINEKLVDKYLPEYIKVKAPEQKNDFLKSAVAHFAEYLEAHPDEMERFR